MTDTSSRPESVRSQRVNKNPIYAFPAKQFPHGIQFIFMDYDYNRFINTLTRNSEGVVTTDSEDPFGVKKLGFVPNSNVPPDIKDYTVLELPFPRQLADANQINNTAFERSFLVERLTAGLNAAAANGDGASGIMSNVGELAKAALAEIRSVGKGDEGNLMDRLGNILTNSTNVGAGTTAAKFLAKSFLPGDILKQIGQAGGQIMNPLQTLAFTGVDLKQYSFTWDLFPTNQADSDRLKAIINILKQKSLPEVSGISEKVEGGGERVVEGFGRAFLKYPSVVRTNFIGVDESHFVRFKPAMLTQVNVDYAGNAGQVVIARGGRPAAITLTLGFTELTIHTANDYMPKEGNTKNEQGGASTTTETSSGAPPAA